MTSLQRTAATLVALGALAHVLVWGGGCSSPPALTLTEVERLSAPELTVGDLAPEIRVDRYVRGGEIVRAGRLTMLEFWASWCGPCVAHMPRSARLERAHEGLTIIALSTVDADNSAADIAALTRQLGDQMPSVVAIDDGQATARAYRVAAREMALPRAFLIDRAGVLLWIGHPADAEGVVEQALAGTWDVERARREREEDAREVMIANRATAQLRAMDRREAGLESGAELPLWEQLAKLKPGNRLWSPPSTPEVSVVSCLIGAGRLADAAAAADRAAAAWSTDARTLANLASVICAIDGSRADALSERALSEIDRFAARPKPDETWDAFLYESERLEIASALTILAGVRFQRGEPALAATHARRALAMSEPVPGYLAEWRRSVETAITRYERAAMGGD